MVEIDSTISTILLIVGLILGSLVAILSFTNKAAPRTRTILAAAAGGLLAVIFVAEQQFRKAAVTLLVILLLAITIYKYQS